MPNMISVALFGLIGSIALLIIGQVFSVIMYSGAEASISGVAPSATVLLNLWPLCFAAVLLIVLVFSIIPIQTYFGQGGYGGGGYSGGYQ